jgi:hypothetical protein
MTAKKFFNRLAALSKDLLFPSESEFPLEPFIWESTTLLPSNIFNRTHKPANTAIESIPLEEFF